ncbi:MULTISPECIES: hypothetical protein [unclassified Flavobacterium]|uniref:hypothetical protein n=1 Tax=unclassified Flavobacterium TaxID=196869 RepID=UPI001F12917F|nr:MULTISPECIES: hypothetical protein [unclassified Flavobacterium]UMY65222.1 hypothetical protein MKO97_12015 [Flavobacterium sp. HJ-32-4]
MQRILMFLFVLALAPIYVSGQAPTTAKDSAAFYKKIEKASKRRGFTRFLHRLVFEPTEIKNSNPIRKPKKRDYKNYNGRIVRNIKIHTLDPFGYSEIDTTRKPRNWGERLGNAVHIKSRQFAIRNLLLIKENRPVDSLMVKESERLIRTQRYVSRVYITATPVSSDSVDINVRVLDSWSLIPKGSISTSRTSVEIRERNILGSGHEFVSRIINDNENGNKAYNLRYTVPTIKNTFIRSTLAYRVDLDGYYGKSLNIERTFFSPFTEWAGGVYVDQQFRRDSLTDISGNYSLQNLKYTSQDLWGGRAFRLFEGTSEDDRTTRLVASGRVLFTQYSESPKREYDLIDYFSGERFVMGGLGISSRQFVEDRYLFNNGIVEDVPIGKIYGLTAGYQTKNGRDRTYLGARASYGSYFRIGYLSGNVEYGTFFRAGALEQTAFSLQLNYFTDLIDCGKWKLRQFIKPLLIIGTNRLASVADRLTINESSGFQGGYGAGYYGYNSAGIQGFNSAINGTKKFVLTFQTQSYSPWQVVGFRLNPFFNYTAAVLGNEIQGLTSNRFYQKIGVGILVSNDYLVFNSFQLSIAFYPTIPGQGDNLFLTNTFETNDFGFQDFEFGKPRTIIYK